MKVDDDGKLIGRPAVLFGTHERGCGGDVWMMRDADVDDPTEPATSWLECERCGMRQFEGVFEVKPTPEMAARIRQKRVDEILKRSDS